MDIDISSEQYKDAIRSVLTNKEVEFLQALYHFPESWAGADDLAKVLGYSAYQVSNRIIGRIGNKISTYLSVKPPEYIGPKGYQPAYYFITGAYTKGRGWKMWPQLITALDELGLVGDDANGFKLLPTEVLPIEGGVDILEGKVTKVIVNKYERDRRARIACIKHYGDSCIACGFSFGKKYGEDAKGFIHVHHVKPLSSIKAEYQVDPIKDLIPLCPNCHSVVHLFNKVLSLDELKELIGTAKKRN